MSLLLKYHKHMFRAEPDPRARGLLKTQELHAPPTRHPAVLVTGAARDQWRAGLSTVWFPKRVQDAQTGSALKEL